MMASRSRGSLEERFWRKVDQNGPIVPRIGTPCWVWTASTTPFGYGRIGLGGRTDGWAAAHRVSWELHHGAIPEAMQVLHRCDNPACVNPKHLFLGTQQDNMLDMTAKGRRNDRRGETHPHAKLTVEQVSEIRGLLATTPKKELARRYGVRYQSIQKIARGGSWKEVPWPHESVAT